MRTALRRAVSFLTLFLALAFCVTLANQTAQLVELASRADPVAGEATLWGLVFALCGLSGRAGPAAAQAAAVDPILYGSGGGFQHAQDGKAD